MERKKGEIMKAFDIRYNKEVEIVEEINENLVKIKVDGAIVTERKEVLVNPETFEPIFG